MPYKFNDSRRHKINKIRYTVTNWRDFNAALRLRGDITIWFTPDAIDQWRPEKTGDRDLPLEYSNHSIETAMFIRQVFKLPLCQTEGFMASIARVMKTYIAIDFNSISRRCVSLSALLIGKAITAGSFIIFDSRGTESVRQK